jgi:tRNA-specific 2-thiouridylase
VTTSPSNIAVALSGGKDSAAAASLLKTAGWRVTGVHFVLPTVSAGEAQARAASVREVARRLAIPLSVVDLKNLFADLVIEPFVQQYLAGLTPNPCVRCNRMVKFEQLLRFADQNGIGYVATGHYARLRRARGRSVPALLRGRDRRKEQSYFLHRLDRAWLARVVFPLGDVTKQEVRARAGATGLQALTTGESQEICFLGGKDYRRFIASRRRFPSPAKGDVVTLDGARLGRHSGAYRYTVGQRRGLGIASGRPYYVKEIRAAANEVVVARKEQLYSRTVEAEAFNWMVEMPCEDGAEVHGQIRYRHHAAPGRLQVLAPDKVRFMFQEPQWAVTPGQALVCYAGDRVLGGGWIGRVQDEA